MQVSNDIEGACFNSILDDEEDGDQGWNIRQVNEQLMVLSREVKDIRQTVQVLTECLQNMNDLSYSLAQTDSAHKQLGIHYRFLKYIC